MAYLITIKSNKIPKYFNYMYNEPGCAKSMKEYAATRKCTAECIAVSALYKDACHKIRHKQGQLSKTLANVDCAKEPVRVVKVLKDLVDMDLIIEAALSRTHKRQLAALRADLRAQQPTGRKTSDSESDDETPQSPRLNDTFESLDSVNQTLMGLTADSVEASINQTAIMESLKSLHRKVEAQDKKMDMILQMLQGMRVGDPVFEEIVSVPQSPSVGLFRDPEPVAGPSRQSEFCIICACSAHSKADCFLYSRNKCERCGAVGHAERLHGVTDRALRSKVISEHGWESFKHFYD